MIDTHCHLDSKQYSDLPAVLDLAVEQGLSHIIVPSLTRRSCLSVKELSEKHSIIVPAYGIHPEEGKDEDLNTLEQFLAPFLKDTVLGEVGLDYHNIFCPVKKQKQLLELQLSIAEKLSIPVIVHSRDAYEDTRDIVRNFDLPRVVFHCFPYGKQEAGELLDLDYFLSFTGIITFKNASEMREVVKYVPIQKLMAETDAPYLTPAPYRGKLNMPHYVEYVIRAIGEIKEIDFSDADEQLTAVARQFFSL